MKMMNKVCALVLSVALCAGMAAPAFAYGGEPVEEAEAAEVNEMVRTAKVTPEQLAALLRQSTTSTPNPAALSAVGATFNKEENSNEDDE